MIFTNTNYVGWHFGPWLVRNTSDYYLAMDAYLEAENQKHPDRQELETDWRSLSRNMAEQISQYLALAAGGEMRHSAGFKGGHRFDIWDIIVFALNGQPDAYAADVLDIWAKRFTTRGNFSGGYGGKPWSQACSITAEWLRGDCSDVMFVELALNLHHNNSCIFNKLALDALTYQQILNTGGAESESLRRQGWPVILDNGSFEWRSRWESLLGHLEIGKASAPKPAETEAGAMATPKTTAGTDKLW